MTCRPTCACQCNQQGCGCHERPTAYVPNRHRTPPAGSDR